MGSNEELDNTFSNAALMKLRYFCNISDTNKQLSETEKHALNDMNNSVEINMLKSSN